MISFSRISRGIDRVVNWLKWPHAVAAVLVLPAAVIVAIQFSVRMLRSPQPVFWFLVGIVAYLSLWWAVIRRSRWRFLQTLEHEITHALFALLTFHRVTRVHATLSRGGHIQFKGIGNWLITISPYFFPTLSVGLMIMFYMIPPFSLRLSDFLLGASLSYHLTSTHRETHIGQSDLKQVGWLFSLAFLPTANVLSFGVVICFAYGRSPAVWHFLRSVVDQTVRLYA